MGKKSKPLRCSKRQEKNYFHSFNEMAKMTVVKGAVLSSGKKSE